MREKNTPRDTKGRFGRLGLPVSKGYLTPAGRGRLLAVGALLAGVAGAFALLDVQVWHGRHLTGGPLSSAHAVLQQDCGSCHGVAPAGGLARGKVSDAACSTCHEKLGDDLGLYTFAAHYVYRSGDFERIAAHNNETPCASCHPEHRGQTASIIQVADRQCLFCHEGHRFEDQHPAFDATVEPPAAEPALAFAHGQHTREVMAEYGFADVERACMACHEPDADGQGFLSIRFDRHCDACHLEAGIATPRLPLLDPAEGNAVGVASLAAIRTGDEPGTQWSLFMDPNEFRTAGGRVMKTPLHHNDPWVLHNLRLLRRLLYPDAGLADLLVGTAEGDVAELYREAARTLRDQIVGLRGSGDPAVQDQLAEMEAQLRRVERALDDPSTALDETEFLLALDRPAELDA
ncbi:MAG: cytochrome c3 family protein, partial [Acidobacteriota bacterium]